MKKNKYYTPTIEEFHVGFEYEILEMGSRTKYNPATLNECDDLTGDHDGSTLLYEIARERQSVRVKYLDQEDIESLGFSKTKMKDESKLSCCNDHDIFKKDLRGFDEYLEVVYFENYAGVSLHHLFPGETKLNNDNKVFFMKIKNKSELKRLLKQLGI
jgi:hypothetical protein